MVIRPNSIQQDPSSRGIQSVEKLARKPRKAMW
jgi:hypothetical protein